MINCGISFGIWIFSCPNPFYGCSKTRFYFTAYLWFFRGKHRLITLTLLNQSDHGESEVGGDSNREIVSFRSFVRALGLVA